MLIENPSAYLRFVHSTTTEAEFLCELVHRTGCGLLFDVNNVYVTCRNLGGDPRTWIEAHPVEAVQELHLAGHCVFFCRKHQSALLRVHPIPTCLFIITAALILSYLLLGGGTIILGAYLNDTVSSIDGGYRLAQGQVAHRDFHTPIGIVHQVLFNVAFDLAGNYADSLAYSVVLPLLVFVQITIFVTVTRYHYYIAIPVAALILLLAASPQGSSRWFRCYRM